MVRRIAQQVHKQVARLMRTNFIKNEPLWYKAVLEHPPIPLPSKAPAPRTQFDLPPTEKAALFLAPKKQRPIRSQKTRPLPIYYAEDDVRRQFFRDHPFEAFRPVTLVEGGDVEDEHPIKGLEWTRLRQRGRNPSAEDAVRFAVNLFEHHRIPLTEAYSRAVAQFRALRSEHDFANHIAAIEAEYYGAQFGPTEIEHAHAKEKKGLEGWEMRAELDEGAQAARKRWKATINRKHIGTWSKGEDYVRLWKNGIRATYSEALITRPVYMNI